MTNLLTALQQNNAYELSHQLSLIMTSYPEIFQHKPPNIPIYNVAPVYAQTTTKMLKTNLVGQKYIPQLFSEKCYFFLKNRSVFALVFLSYPVFLIFNYANAYPIQLNIYQISQVLFAPDLSKILLYSTQGGSELFLSNLIYRYVQLKNQYRAAVLSVDGSFIMVDGAIYSALLGDGNYAVLFLNSLQVYLQSTSFYLSFEAVSMRVNGYEAVIFGAGQFILLRYSGNQFEQVEHYSFNYDFYDYCVVAGCIYVLLANGNFVRLDEDQQVLIAYSIHCICFEGEEAVWGVQSSDGGVEMWRGVFA